MKIPANTCALLRLILATGLSAVPLRAQSGSYTVTDLGRLAGAYTTVPWGMNNQGAVVGWCQGPVTDTRAFLWTAATGITELPQLPGVVQNTAYAISDGGVIVGAGRTSLTGPLIPWRIMNGTLQAIPRLPVAPGATARGVNDAGQVVGWTTDADPFHPVTHGFFWSDATGLIDITGGEANATAINNQGVVVGSVAVGTTGRVFSWTLAGGIQVFPPLSGQCSDGAFAINELGQISCGNTCGGGSGPSTGTRPYVYTPGSGMQIILPLAGSSSYGVDINRWGQLVSTIHNYPNPDRAWIYTPQAGQQLLDETQIDPALGYSMSRAIAIDDSGRIVGSASSVQFPNDGFSRAVLLTPLGPAITPFCSGDGTGTACPCANDGAAGHGCENSAGTGGALLTAAGVASLAADTVQLTSSGERPTALSVVLQGSAALAPASYGDGLRCAGGTLKRLYVRSASGGVLTAPQPGDPSVSARSAALGDVLVHGETRHYQVYYRDPAPGFCPDPLGDTWNVTNGISITWQ